MEFCLIMSHQEEVKILFQKTIIGIIKVLKGYQKCLYLGNLKSKRIGDMLKNSECSMENFATKNPR